ncbi:MAG: nucleotidyltransferase domain-containing protein [Thermoplasmataceae archaeon]
MGSPWGELDEALAYIKSEKGLLSEELGKKVSYSDVIKRCVGNEVRMHRIRPDVLNYVKNYSFGLSLDERVLGIVLFGSYVRGTDTTGSDIDLFTVFNGTLFDGLKLFSAMDRKLEPIRKKIVSMGRYAYVSPFIVDTSNLFDNMPIYFDVMDFGVVLFQKDNTINNFYKWLNTKKHRRNFLFGKEALSWTK